MKRNGQSMVTGSLAMAIVCLALTGAAAAEKESKKPVDAVTEETAAPGREIPSAEERAQRLTEQMKQQLGLTEEQIPRVTEINLRTAKQVDDIRKATEGDRSERSNKARSVQEQRDKDLKQILTKEQWEKFEKMKDEMKSKARDRAKKFNQKGGGGGQGGDRAP